MRASTGDGGGCRPTAGARGWRRAGSPRRGILLVELVVGIAVILTAILPLATVLTVQARKAATLSRQAHARLLLEGEMERIRGLPAGKVEPCSDEAFEPFLGRPRALSGAQFRKSVVLEQEGRLAQVRLEARLVHRGELRRGAVVESLVHLRQEGSP